MNRLELARRLAAKCGELRNIRTLNDATGLVADYADWIDDAWRDLQNNIGWRWMRRQFVLETNEPSTLTPTQSGAVYDVTQLKDAETDAYLTGVQKYRLQDPNDPPEIALRVGDDPVEYGNWTYLLLTDWGAWKWLYHFHRSARSKPHYIAVTPDNKIALGPAPPAEDVYAVRGDHYARPAVMEGDLGEPVGLPEEYHMLLVYDAMLHYAHGRVAPEVLEESKLMSHTIRAQLEAVQSDPFRLAPPLV